MTGGMFDLGGGSSRGRGQRTPDAPPVPESRVQAARRYAGHLRPFRHTQGFALKRQPADASRVASLRKAGGPPAIIRRVGTVVVDAVERVLWGRTIAHVREEVLEAVQPAVAHADAAPAIIGEGPIPRVYASLFSVRPTVVLPGLCATVRELQANRVFDIGAATGPCWMGLAANVGQAKLAARPTVADADDESTSVAPAPPARRISDNNEAPEPLPDYVNWSHGSNFTVFCGGVA